MDQQTLYLSISGLLAISLASCLIFSGGSSKYKLPPRVPGVPIFGNALQVPPTQQGPWAKALAEKYGEMFTVKFGGSTWVFLNSSRVVTELMERRAAIYSSRPPFPMTQDIMSGGSRIVLMPYNNRWRATRKIMHQILSTRQKDVFRYANSIIMSVVFGVRSMLDGPEVVDLFETVEMFLEQQQPGANIVDGFPILAQLPAALQWWRPRGRKMFEITRAQRDCFAVDFLKLSDNDYFNETQKLFVLGTLIVAGKREQLDAVCGSNAERLPGWNDKESLPYITATVKEIFRWRPNIAEIGAPTSLTKDDEFEGYRFPKDTVFVWNVWAIALDPKEYPEPERFYPERFLNDGLNNSLKGHWAFGPGRRVCVGWNVGEMNVWIAAARLLYCFDFTEDKLTKKQAPFDVNIKVRSAAHAALIERDCAAATTVRY
ncbi:cytochrome P450 [Bisporella sp. PMI_857]|nr:cytochrome P450 [Bisporella sp. PMI_857]